MIVHIPATFGDIEVVATSATASTIHYMNLSRAERKALQALAVKYKFEISDRGDVTVAAPLADITEALAPTLDPGGRGYMTAVRYRDGKIEVRDGSFRAAFGDEYLADGGTPEKVEESEPERAVQSKKPKRGCPKPDWIRIAEEKARRVVRHFLDPQQLADFDESNAIAARGCHTGRLYLIRSRWNTEIETFGSLYDATRRMSICASMLEVPPAEELLSLKFAVEHDEAAFLGTHH